jgi:hypothetical protein
LPRNRRSQRPGRPTRRGERSLRTPSALLAGVEPLEQRTLFAAFTGDGFGYVADPVPGESIDLQPGGDGVVALLQDEAFNSAPLDLGTNTFSFYGRTYTGADALYVSPNGVITLGGTSYTFYNSDLTDAPDQPSIAPLWDQWAADFSSDDQVLARFDNNDADPEPDRLVVEWNGVQNYYNHYYGSTDQSPVTFQAILSLNTGNDPGDVVFNYVDTGTDNYYQSDGGTAAVGIKDAGYQGGSGGGRRLLVSYYPAYYGGGGVVASGQALRVYWGGNDAPTAEAGPPAWYGADAYSVPAGYFVQLDASQSSDPQQGNWTLAYEWDFDGDGVFGEYAWDGGENGTEQGMFPVFDAHGLSAGESHPVTLRVTDGGGLVDEDTATVDITVNQSPTADAGPPWWYGTDAYTVVEGRYVQLDGGASVDPEGYLDSFTWDLDNDGVLGEYAWDGGDNGDEVGVYPTFFANGLHDGDSRTITLQVTDRGGLSDTDTATVNVIANQPPVADAGPPGGGNYTATVGSYTYLNAYATHDPDEGLNWDAFKWDLDGDGVFGEAYWNGGTPDRGDEVGPTPAFLAAGLEAGQTVTVALRVTDSGGLTGEDTATIDIVPNHPPVADAGPYPGADTYVTYAGYSAQLYGGYSYDPDGDYIPWENYTWDLDGDGIFGESNRPGDDPQRGWEVGYYTYFDTTGITTAGVYPVALRVTDYLGNVSQTDTAFVQVLTFDPVPVIQGAPASGVEGAAIPFESTVYNSVPDLTYAWTVTKDGSPDVYAAGTLPSFSFVPYEDGDYRVRLAVTTPEGTTSELTPQSDVTIHVANAAPTLNGITVDSSTIDEGGTVTLTGSYNDPGSVDGHTATIDWGDGTSESLTLGAVGPNLPLSAPRQFNGHTYYAIQAGELTWAQAEAEAVRLGGHLVTIGDADENRFVTDFGRFVYGDRSVWIGLNDATSEGTFAWASGEAVGYANFSPNEPNNFPTFGGEDYAELRLWGRNGDGGMWNDLPVGGTLGSRIYGAVIELPGAPSAPVAPTFTATHRYADSGQYTVTAALADDDGAAANLPRGLARWRAADGGNDHYYLLTDGTMVWEDAEAQAVSLGGHLVSILSPEENAFLVDHFTADYAAYTIAWTGFTDAAVEGDWHWTSGEPVTYTNWHYNEPNNFGGNQDNGTFNYHFLGTDPNGLWDDDGTVLRPGIVELGAAPAGMLPTVGVTVKNVAPVITAASSNGAEVGDKAPGQTVTVSAAFTDAGADTHTLSVNWGDGATTSGTVSEVAGSGTGSAGHAYTTGGVYNVVLTVTDDDGATDTRSLTVYVSGSRVYNGELQVVGTGGADNATIKKLGSTLVVQGVGASTTASGVQRILVLLGGGDDVLTVDGSVTTPATIFAGAGNDQVKCGNGINVVGGGGGDDALTGGTARDVLIGGAGADRLNGNAGDDVLVAGTTAYDADPAALDAIRAEWGRDLPFNTRVANLAAGVGPGGSIKLGAGTVFDDAATDVLTGTAGSDWFLLNGTAGKSSISDKTSADLATQVGVL